MSAILDGYVGIQREPVVAALSDEELVHATYDLVEEIDDEIEDDHDLRDRFYVVLTEVFERFAPAAEWAYSRARLEDDPQIERELEATRGAMLRRAAYRIRRFPIEGAS